MQLKIEQADLEAVREKLTIEKEAAANVAEAEALEAATDPDERSIRSNVLGSEQDPVQHTSE